MVEIKVQTMFRKKLETVLASLKNIKASKSCPLATLTARKVQMFGSDSYGVLLLSSVLALVSAVLISEVAVAAPLTSIPITSPIFPLPQLRLVSGEISPSVDGVQGNPSTVRCSDLTVTYTKFHQPPDYGFGSQPGVTTTIGSEQATGNNLQAGCAYSFSDTEAGVAGDPFDSYSDYGTISVVYREPDGSGYWSGVEKFYPVPVHLSIAVGFSFYPRLH